MPLFQQSALGEVQAPIHGPPEYARVGWTMDSYGDQPTIIVGWPVTHSNYYPNKVDDEARGECSWFLNQEEAYALVEAILTALTKSQDIYARGGS
jgi:hypothetical protein